MPETVHSELEEVNCDFCGNPKYQLILTKKIAKSKKFFTFTIVKCTCCGHYFLRPRPKDKSLLKFYEEGYEPIHLLQSFIDKADSPRDRVVKKILIRFYSICWGKQPKKFLDKIKNFLFLLVVKNRLGGRINNIKPRCILDVGPGDGFFLWAIRPLGWNTWGVDINPRAVANAGRVGIKMKLAESSKTGFESESFDVVRMYDLLEHVPSPTKTLKEASRVLKSKGLLVVKTPQFPSLFDRIFGKDSYALEIPRHLQFFTKKKLVEFIEREDFKVVKVNLFSMGTNLLTLEKKGLIPKFSSIPGMLSLSLAEIPINIFGLGDSVEVYALKK